MALAEYTNAPFVVTTNSCTMALFLALKYHRYTGSVILPSRTYCSVPMAVIHAGMRPHFEDYEWGGEYPLTPLPVMDSARRFRRGMYRPGMMQCASFQTSKILGIEQGGAILHDNAQADEWLRRARFDGRLNASERLPRQLGFHAYMSPSVAAMGIAKLACLPDAPPDNGGSYLFDDLSKLTIWP